MRVQLPRRTNTTVLQKGGTVYVPEAHGRKDTTSPITSILLFGFPLV
jgi:hypothetical protein